MYLLHLARDNFIDDDQPKTLNPALDSVDMNALYLERAGVEASGTKRRKKYRIIDVRYLSKEFVTILLLVAPY